MGDQTGISWADATWNPIVGCSLVSPGCTHCYAMQLASRLAKMGTARYDGLTQVVNGHSVWTGEVRLVEDGLALPLHWKKPRRIFVNSMSDLFHESVPVSWIAAIFNVITDARCEQHIFQTLTKRARRMYEVMTDELPNYAATHYGGDTPLGAALEAGWPPRNWWAGISAEDQTRLNERRAHLLGTPAAVRYISVEPLLGFIDLALDAWYHPDYSQGKHDRPAFLMPGVTRVRELIDWVIVGGESGARYRPMEMAWLKFIVDQCRDERVKVFVKQDSGPKPGQQGRIPDELWIQEWPEVVTRGA